MTNKPFLFQDRYDLNRERITLHIDPDDPNGDRYPNKQWDVEEFLLDNGLSFIVYEKGVIRDIRINGDHPADAKWEEVYEVRLHRENDQFVKIVAKTPEAQKVVDRYLQSVEVYEKCKHCLKELVGHDALRYNAACETCAIEEVQTS